MDARLGAGHDGGGVVLAGPVPAIHVFPTHHGAKTWMPGPRPGMTGWSSWPGLSRPSTSLPNEWHPWPGATATLAHVPGSIEETLTLLENAGYVADRALATVLFLALKLGRPLFLEGEAGVGKTEVAKVLSSSLGRRLIRLQCYEGLDVASAVYEWNYAGQMMAIRLAEAGGDVDRDRLEGDLFSERYLVKRPLLRALEPGEGGPAVLLVDEVDRTDEAFEAFLLEVLSDFQVTVPEFGTITAAEPPIVIITSNRTREIHDALKRRCLYHWVDFPEAARELNESAAYYDDCRPGLGDEFLTQVELGITRIVDAPLRSREIEPGVRRYLIARFPFGLIYHIIRDDVVEIVSVMHLRRRPGYWRDRL